MKILELGLKEYIPDEIFFSHWAVTNNCNYKCDYCVLSKCEKYSNEETCNKIIEFYNYINKTKKLILVLFGGEPTIHPLFLDILNKLNAAPKIFTNLSKNISFLENIVNINNNVEIITSYHHRITNINNFIDKIKFLVENVKFVRIKIMYELEFAKEIENIFYEVKELDKVYDNCLTTLDMVYKPNQNITTDELNNFLLLQTDKQYYVKYRLNNKIIEEDISYNQIRALGNTSFKYYRCMSGRKNIFVDFNGDVFFCQTMRNMKRKPIFNLMIDDFKNHLNIFKSDIICFEDDCCSEVSVPKYWTRK
jgi:MoaA/NifB/PqqE/SkfB family radical SAM enzyme